MIVDQSPIQKMRTSAAKRSDDKTSSPATSRLGTWWSRHCTVVNFWLDFLLLIVFVVQAWILSVLHFVFPRGAGPDWTIWGANLLDWTEALCVTYAIFSVAILVHVMFHWTWICGVVSTRVLGRKAGKDDGSQTLIGVGLIVFLVHVLIAGILVAKAGLVGPQ
jgi:hypothetical protein